MDLLEKEWFIEAPWGRLAIIAWGNCLDEPVLMTHGRVDSVVNFKPLLHHLPKNFYYVGVEIPGHGKSDPYPKGLMINSFDIVYVLRVVVNHFRWKRFIYMGHSLATLLGKIYNLSYPGEMSRVIDLDPTPAYEAIPPEEFVNWYHKYYTQFFNNYHKFNASKETAPIYTREQALALIERNRGITGEAANIILDRLSEPIGENLIRFTFDQRSKIITRPPFPASHREKLFTSIETPTLTIVADNSVKLGLYDKCPFALDENAYPRRNYRVREVAGNHDVHIIHPDRVARYVKPFLLYGLEGLDSKAKL